MKNHSTHQLVLAIQLSDTFLCPDQSNQPEIMGMIANAWHELSERGWQGRMGQQLAERDNCDT